MVLLVLPYLFILDQGLPAVKEGLAQGEGAAMLAVRLMTQEAEQAPGDITRLLAVLLGVDPVWLAANATAAELFECIPVLDRYHGLTTMVVRLYKSGVYRRWQTADH